MSTTSEDGTGTSRPALERALGTELNALLSASRALTERSAARFHSRLRPAAFHLARWIYAYGPTKPSALAREVGMDRSSTSSLIRQMRDLGLVDSTPDPADSRGVIVALTNLGNERVADALDLRGSEFFERTATWNAQDLTTLVGLLHRFNTDPGGRR
jgi:DNA-binding MarR family transcriptional regulator